MPAALSTESTPSAGPTSVRGRSKQRRNRALDVAKGVAIIAIVVSHVLRALADTPTLDRTSGFFLEVDDALYSWHVALFALAAGVLLPRGVDKRGPTAYLRPRLVLFGYLYVVWTTLQAGAKALEGWLVNGTVDGLAFLRSFAEGYGQLWWLGFMVVASVAGAVARPWSGRRRALWTSALVGVVALAAWGWTGPWLFEEGLALLAYFWAGMLLGRHGLGRLSDSPALAVRIALAGLAVGVAALALGDPVPPTSWLGERTVSGIALGVLTTTALTAGVLAGSVLLSRTVLVRPLARLGKRSLDIFLGHLLAITVVLVLLDWWEVTSPGVLIVAATGAGLLLPLGVRRLGRRVGFPWLFASPWPRSRPPH